MDEPKMINDPHEIYEKYKFLLTEGNKPSKTKDILLHELGYLSKNLEYFLCNFNSDTICNKKNDIVSKLTELIVSFGLVKEFQHSEDRDFGPEDFPFEAQNAEECFEYLNYLLLHYKDIDTSSRRKFLVQVLLLCATHNSKYLWSSSKSVALCSDFLKKLLETTNYKTLNSLLCDDIFHPTIFKGTQKWMRPHLLRNTWMKTPSNCYVFFWLLSHVKHPHLVDYLHDVLPPSHMFVTYYAVPQQVIGIKCFDHILDNVPPSLIKANGIEDAIFNSLKNYKYSKEIPIVEVFYPCLLKLPMMNLKKVNHMEWLEFDDIFQQLLLNMHIESNPKLRYLFLNHIYLYVQVTPIFKHLKKAMNFLLDNFCANSTAEEECRIVVLKIVKEIIKSCWPRMEHYCPKIMSSIIIVLYDIDHPHYSADKNLLKILHTLCKDCLHLLKISCPAAFKKIVDEYTQDDSMPGADLLRSIS